MSLPFFYIVCIFFQLGVPSISGHYFSAELPATGSSYKIAIPAVSNGLLLITDNAKYPLGLGAYVVDAYRNIVQSLFSSDASSGKYSIGFSDGLTVTSISGRCAIQGQFFNVYIG